MNWLVVLYTPGCCTLWPARRRNGDVVREIVSGRDSVSGKAHIVRFSPFDFRQSL